MTTEFQRNQHPRLPANYAEHLDKMAPPEERNAYGFCVLVVGTLILIFAELATLIHELLSS